MKLKSCLNYKHTMYACFIGYITQSVVVNFFPLLFTAFNREFGLTLDKITFLISVAFIFQIGSDFTGALLCRRISNRLIITAGHILSAAGLVLMAFLPYIMEDSFTAIFISVACYSTGGGFIEVLVSPLMEGLPIKSEAKAPAMSLLHSFYCWGFLLTVIVSTLFFSVFGIDNWRYLSLLWSLIPAFGAVVFSVVPIVPYGDNSREKSSVKNIFSEKMFLLMALLMICAGAAEQAMAQWASAFAEEGLKVSKQTGDLLGPSMFALFQGISRLFYGRYGERIRLEKFLFASSLLCVISYIMSAFSPYNFISFAGCALCGLSVGIMWPGVLSLASARCENKSTAMLAYLALFGDIGCSAGPFLVGRAASGTAVSGIKTGISMAMVFPVVMIFAVYTLGRGKKSKEA